MIENLDVLMNTPLFAGVGSAEMEPMLRCLDARFTRVKKDEIVLLQGSKPTWIGIVLSGQLHIVREDYDGNAALIAAVAPGEVFAEALCCAGVAESPITVIAAADSAMAQLRFDKLLHPCERACAWHTRLVDNMVGLIARKNLLLQQRMDIMAIHSVREKVLRYLGSFDRPRGRIITLPFNREGMANYLCVERSALSHELSRMQRDGLIEFRKNKFKLLM